MIAGAVVHRRRLANVREMLAIRGVSRGKRARSREEVSRSLARFG
jgi:hypothetical protein